ncbi:helix-turn-helix domain-containing protein [Romboutsia sp.]|uniref:helix-turn-helix domain-containing protein n=1 Tax=Romboutsia sp. TaxID=1965302 RepID=UPI003F407275
MENEKEFNKLVGRKLASIRCEMGKTRSEVCKEAGITISCLFHWEKGDMKASFQGVYLLCKYYNYPVSKLITMVDNKFTMQNSEIED